MNGRFASSVVAIAAMAAAVAAADDEPIWRAAAPKIESTACRGRPSASPLLVLRLDRDRLEDRLERPSPIVELPMPDGSLGRFAVKRSRTMSPGLAAQFPEIRAFRGAGVDDPASTARFSLTPAGFHGMVLTPKETVFIDPIPCDGTDLYASFRRSDRSVTPGARIECGLADSTSPNRSPAPAKAIGPELRILRTAIAATGEYTQYHGGTKNTALQAIVVVMNRINGIFGRELSVEFELVADTTRVIYTDPDTDPYTFDDTATLILENQDVLDRRIGSANYDHGHLFNTYNGGRSGAHGTVCDHLLKGQGVSGLRRPEGETFMVDLVAHEMGHQLGAAHTYNSIESVCSIARNEWAAYEPGSGSTIMSYAGVCGIENITAHSDDYFHGFSLDEISAYLGSWGGSCGSVVATGNDPPQVDAGSGHTIPAGTPFTLTGSGTDASPLSFTWEQFDLGPPSPPMTDDGQRPLFRSRPPAGVPWRVLPAMDDLLNATSSIGEVLPTTTRRLTFRVTARDGLGGVGHDTTELQVDATTGPFRVTAPTSGDRWAGGETATVAWDVAGTDGGAVACAAVDILLSTDDGATFDYVLAEATANDGAEQITAPATTSTEARVLIACSDNIFFALSPRIEVIWQHARQPAGRVSP